MRVRRAPAVQVRRPAGVVTHGEHERGHRVEQLESHQVRARALRGQPPIRLLPRNLPVVPQRVARSAMRKKRKQTAKEEERKKEREKERKKERKTEKI